MKPVFALMLTALASFTILFPLQAQAAELVELAEPDLSPGSEHLQIIDLRGFQQTTDYTCGPASAVSLLKFYGLKGDEMTLAKQMKSVSGAGTNIANLAKGLEQQGFSVKWALDGSLQMLRANLARKVPTIVGWMDWGGHYVICVGYDDRGTENVYDDLIVFADPADFYDGVRDGLTWFNAKRFESMWMVRGDTAAMPWVKGMYVVATPKG